MKQKVYAKDLFSINNVLYELTCLRRWSEVLVEAGKYTELAKQALNSMIAYVWAMEAIHVGVHVDLTVFPKISISRAYTKSYQCDVPEINLDRIFQLGNVSKESFADMIQSQISKVTSENFRKHINFDSNSLEAKIYRGATKVATLLELEEIKNGISAKEYHKKHQQLENDIKSYCSLPGYRQMCSEIYLEIFRDFSQLRNRIRWAKHPNIIKCSVLGHHFDVAIFSYLMSLEVKPYDEALATRYFFMGIFHDFPEKWTGDMPSPIKDSIKGLREATEEFENEVMEQNVYSHLPYYQEAALRDVMLEDKNNAQLKKFSKISDNFSAFVECWRELDAGSRHQYYVTVLEKDYKNKEKLPDNFRLLTEKLYGVLYCR